jgi:hypothetical protein
MGGVYEVCPSDRFIYHDVHTKFDKYYFRHSKVDTGDTQTQDAGKVFSLCN